MTSHVDTFDPRPRCIGGCGRTVSDPGKWCSMCWPIDVSSKHVDQKDPRRPEPVKESQNTSTAPRGSNRKTRK